MVYKYRYETPNGFSNILMNSNGKDLTGLWFEGSRDALKHKIECEEKDLPIFKETSKWLDIYFSGKIPNFIPKYKLENLTSFRKEVRRSHSSPWGNSASCHRSPNPSNR